MTKKELREDREMQRVSRLIESVAREKREIDRQTNPEHVLEYDPMKQPDPHRWSETNEIERYIAIEEYHDRNHLSEDKMHIIYHLLAEDRALGKPYRDQLAALLAEGMDRHEAIHELVHDVETEVLQRVEDLYRAGEEVNPDNLTGHEQGGSMNAEMSNQRTLEELFTALEQKAKRIADGHYTLFKFTSNYRGCFGTFPDTDDPAQRMVLISSLSAFPTLREIVEYLVDVENRYIGDVLEQMDPGTFTEDMEEAEEPWM